MSWQVWFMAGSVFAAATWPFAAMAACALALVLGEEHQTSPTKPIQPQQEDR